MIRIMKATAVTGFIFTLIFALLNHIFFSEALLALAITAGTVTYHFGVRLFIGYAIDGIYKNNPDYRKPWFRQLPFEEKLYSFLRVKNWKGKMPTAAPESFDLRVNPPMKVVGAMCQAEIVHEVIIIASFLPIISTVWFGSFWVFFITSLFSACYDLIFVIMQRFNRPRIIKIAEKLKVRSS